MKEIISFPLGIVCLIATLILGACSHPLEDPWLNKTSPYFHGNSSLNCAKCHDLTTDCNDCHFGASGSKSSGDWTHGMDPHDHLSGNNPVCNNCHDLNRIYGNGPGICHDCHSSSGIHVTGESWLNNSSPDFHGNSSLNCADCHDFNNECSECHFGPSGSKSPSDWIHGTDSHAHLTGSAPVCNTCHDLNRSYGNGPGACHDCHGLLGIHVTGEAWFNNSSPDFHGNSSLNCADCHDLNVECNECHFGASGNKSPGDWVHGTNPNDELFVSSSVCNNCHELSRGFGNGPGVCHDCHGLPDSHVRGESWLNTTSPDFHGNSTLNCADCHDPGTECSECHFDSSGSKSPSDWVHGAEPHDDLTSSEPICNTCHELSRGFGNGPGACHDCHELENSHGVPFSDHAVQASSNPASCQECHGASLEGGAGPACSECHMAGSPLTALNCTSCHDKPPAGSDYPNTNGAHTVHNLLAGVTGSCGTCHQGAGSQSSHHNDAVVDIDFSGYNAQSGTASYNHGSGSCSGVSCHGGKDTPDWFSESINVNTQCGECHSSGGEYNSYASGEHRKHVQGEGHSCTECHDTNKLQAVHFNDLGTPQMNQAAQTIRDELNYNGQYCLFTCHFGNENKQHDEEKDW